MKSLKSTDADEKTIRKIAQIVSNRPLSEAIYRSVNTGLRSRSAHIAGEKTVWDVFKHSLEEAIRDIKAHPRGKLFRRLIEYGVPYPDDPEVLISDERERLSDPECGSCVEFIYSHMISRFKGELAELLALEPCLRLLERLKRNGQVSTATQLYWGDLIKEPCEVSAGPAANPTWGRFRKGADGLLVEKKDGVIKIEGVVEVKSMARSRKKLLTQIDKHIARLHGGVELERRRFPADNVEFSREIRIAVIPSSWKLTREWRKVKNKRGWNMKFPKASEPLTPTHTEKLDVSFWKITLAWSQEALHQAAYQMTFWYMAQVGKHIFKKKQSLPSSWTYMTSAEAGQNASKETLFYIPMRYISWRQRRKAVTLYNVYGYGYPIGVDAPEILTRRKGSDWRNEILWPEDVLGEE